MRVALTFFRWVPLLLSGELPVIGLCNTWVFSAQSCVGELSLCSIGVFSAQSWVGELRLCSIWVFFAQSWDGRGWLC